MGSKLQLRKKEEYEDFYKKIRAKIMRWVSSGELNRKTQGWVGKFTEYLVVLPDIVYLLIKLLFDREVPKRTKSLIGIALAYLISPIDIIPDFVPVAGLVDDLLVTVIILNRIINGKDPIVLNKISEYWPGKSDVFEQIRKIVFLINEFASELPKGILKFMKENKK